MVLDCQLKQASDHQLLLAFTEVITIKVGRFNEENLNVGAQLGKACIQGRILPYDSLLSDFRRSSSLLILQ